MPLKQLFYPWYADIYALFSPVGQFCRENHYLSDRLLGWQLYQVGLDAL